MKSPPTPPSPRALLAVGVVLGIALLLHARWLPVWLVSTAFPVTVLAVVARWHGSGPVPALWRLLLLVAVCAAITATQPSFFGREAGAALLASMLVLKLLETASVRDARLVVMVANFLAMAAFLRDQGIGQMIATTVLLLLVLIALRWLRDDAAGKFGKMPLAGVAASLPTALRQALFTLAVVIPFAIASFMFFPRLGSPLWGSADTNPRSRIGIDDELELGALSGLALDDSPAFRVRFLGNGEAPASRDRYWRALVFWTFDGRVWHGSRRFSRVTEPVSLEAANRRYEYEVTLASAPREWRFVLDAPLSASPDIRIGVDLQARGEAGSRGERRYRAVSATRYRLQAKLPEAQRISALELPAESNPRARQLAARWRAAHPVDDDAVIGEALAMVRERFVYSLDPPPLDRNAIDEFLFRTRIGFCEHYASSFVFLMRAAGIPSRIVTGYQGGYRNAAGGYWIVRQSDAHAWAEVWLRGRGWVRVDPTAAVAPERVLRGGAAYSDEVSGSAWFASSGWWTGLRDRADLAGAWWQRAVVEFDALRQENLLEQLGVEATDRLQSLLVWGAITLSALGLAGLLLMLRRTTRESRWRTLYRDFEQRLARAGVSRRSSEGPRDFAQRAADMIPESAESILRIASGFIALRYAPTETDYSRESARMDALSRQICALRLKPARDAAPR